MQLTYIVHSTKQGRGIKWEGFGIKEWGGQREENRKGARSQSLLMQMVAPLKESREAERVPFKDVVIKY